MRLRFYRNLWLVVLFDISLLALSYYGAYWLRFEGHIDATAQAFLIRTLPPLLACKLLCFTFFDLYRGMWRYTGIKD